MTTKENEVKILILSRDRRILWANKRMIDDLNVREVDIVGKYCYQVIHLEGKSCEHPFNVCPLKLSLKTHARAKAIHTHFDKKGNKIYVEITIYPIKNKCGEIVQFGYIAKDILYGIGEKKLKECLWANAVDTVKKVCSTLEDTQTEVEKEKK